MDKDINKNDAIGDFLVNEDENSIHNKEFSRREQKNKIVLPVAIISKDYYEKFVKFLDCICTMVGKRDYDKDCYREYATKYKNKSTLKKLIVIEPNDYIILNMIESDDYIFLAEKIYDFYEEAEKEIIIKELKEEYGEKMEREVDNYIKNIFEILNKFVEFWMELNSIYNSEKLYILIKRKKLAENMSSEMDNSINYENNQKNINILYCNTESDKKNINQIYEDSEFIDDEIENCNFLVINQESDFHDVFEELNSHVKLDIILKGDKNDEIANILNNKYKKRINHILIYGKEISNANDNIKYVKEKNEILLFFKKEENNTSKEKMKMNKLINFNK